MPLKVGDNIICKYQPKYEQYKAEVLSVKDEDIVVRQLELVPVSVFKGQNVFFMVGGSGYFAEIVNVEDNKIYMKSVGAEERDSFRVEDVMPVIVKKVDGDAHIKRAKVISEVGVDMSRLRKYVGDVADDTVSPAVWKMLVDINAKLGVILDMLTFGREGLMNAEEVQVNISASGMSLNVNERYSVRDCVEVKMLLPTSPPVGVIVYGVVVRVRDLKTIANSEIAITFIDMEEDVRDELLQYTLKRQREILRRQREIRIQ
ncbi:MAG: PilZ domain-containing protein [Candidatus Magnetobacterium sp. LHC-1]|uniref:PilZ domain-containing protein n=1 Tax=Candidatus Magnetobacterium casense TaxID=1455061 RepID=A0ABS6RYT1_9BACT|nr:PilZ domain-containing protein [Candidatus Magnetobacterium casensis]MBF0608534.1 PilZ domain-containing protein [Nitrospirota bacterium]MBV6341805.1 PilZ domain-containing protein [Candidatus Magnetobacterium casensis]